MSLTHPPPVLLLLLQGLDCPKRRLNYYPSNKPFIDSMMDTV